MRSTNANAHISIAVSITYLVPLHEEALWDSAPSGLQINCGMQLTPFLRRDLNSGTHLSECTSDELFRNELIWCVAR